MSDSTKDDPDTDGTDLISILIGPDQAGIRLDKALAIGVATAEAAPDRSGTDTSHIASILSRGRIQTLLALGAVSLEGSPVTDGSSRALAGIYHVRLPALIEATPQPEALPLNVLYEDAELVVIEKPAGMAAHPAPGNETGTLVNALLHHCGTSLSGIGGVARPGIVHRLDKDTSGVMVAAKTDRAHAGLSRLFAAHDIERTYVALTRGAPAPASGRIETRIGRSTSDRKKMAVLKAGGRNAITDYVVEARYGMPAKAGAAPLAARVACTLHTGRTHQIRVHMASKGSPILGDAVYGSGSPAAPVRTAMLEAGLTRQALHASVLGFIHPVTGEPLRFETELPADMAGLQAVLTSL
ncbi:MAG: RluA family pseudouridine synthase [Caulobacteraceae bacterium]|nr:RluA family pseudouridine synthase [Caulobacteraceae bacterium]